MKMKQDTKIAIFGFVALLLIFGYYFSDNILNFVQKYNPNGVLAVTASSCVNSPTYDKVGIQWTLQGEQNRLKSLIPSCTNPSNVFTGDYKVDVVTPKGNTYRLGAYDFNNFITCGSTDAGGVVYNTIPNEHTADNFQYTLKIYGNYYLSSENYTIPHPYAWTDSAYAHCIASSDTCPDGTQVNKCSTVQPGKYCTSEAYLVDRAPFCPCPSGYEAQEGQCFKKGDTNPPPPPPQNTTPKPSPSPSPQPNPNPQPNPTPSPTPQPSPSPQPTNQNDKALYAGLAALIVFLAMIYYFFIRSKRKGGR